MLPCLTSSDVNLLLSLPPSLPPFLSDKTTMNDMLDVASNIKTLGGFLQAEPVGAYERADQGMNALPVRA